MGEVVKHGPDGFTGIAIFGSAPSSSLLGPFDDPSWAIWATSPSCWAQLQGRRTDVWFEVHRFIPYPPGQNNLPGTKPGFSPEFRQHLINHPCVYMTEGHPDIPNCHRFPYDDMIRKHGRYHFQSSVPLMMALAIEDLLPLVEQGKHPKLALFGIDMAAQSEYSDQRPACQHFLGLAASLGIQVVFPPESDLMMPPPVYGLVEHHPRYIKLAERQKELEAQKQQAEQALQHAQLSHQRILGSLEMLEYVMSTWCEDVDPNIVDAYSYSGTFKKTLPPLRVANA